MCVSANIEDDTMNKWLTVVLIAGLAACSSEDATVGNGPGNADGVGGRADQAAGLHDISGGNPQTGGTAQTDRQPQGGSTRERPPIAGSQEAGNMAVPRTRETQATANQESGQITNTPGEPGATTNPLANSKSAATRVASADEKSAGTSASSTQQSTADQGSQDRAQSERRNEPMDAPKNR
jgi:hypothetical protein